ncbi:MAG: hypothetical protein ABI876_02900, partial [Bacteroidota bacterium]
MRIRQFSFILTILTAYVFGSQCHAQNPLGTRVGNDIDAEEQEYFGLFPKINGFISAHVTAADGGTIIAIVRKEGDTLISLGPEATKELETYLDHLEDIVRGQQPLRWDSLAGIIRPGSPMQNGDRLEVKTRDGELHVGALLFSTDSTIALWEGTDPYDWR